MTEHASVEPPTKKLKQEKLDFKAGRKLKKIISGGQTGADRAGLEAALQVGFETGGYAPKDFSTSAGSDLALRDVFGLQELSSGRGIKVVSLEQMYVRRSMKNVDVSDGTIAFRVKASPGTDKTIGYCKTQKWNAVSRKVFPVNSGGCYRPCLIVENLEDDVGAIDKVVTFVQKHRPETLNVCGHRETNIMTVGRGIFSSVVRSILVRAFTEIKHLQE